MNRYIQEVRTDALGRRLEAQYRNLPYPRATGRAIRHEESDLFGGKGPLGIANDVEATWYERSEPGFRCRIGLHPTQLALDVWVNFDLHRKHECPCGKRAFYEVY